MVRPYKTKSINRTEIINWISILMFNVFRLTNQKGDFNNDTTDYLGYCIMGTVVLNIFYQILSQLLHFVKRLIKRVQEHYSNKMRSEAEFLTMVNRRLIVI